MSSLLDNLQSTLAFFFSIFSRSGAMWALWSNSLM